MAATYIYKPSTSKGPVVLVPDSESRTPPTITGPDGKTYTGKYLNTNEGRHQFVFDPAIIGINGGKLSFGGKEFTIESGGQSYEGSDLTNLQPRSKGSVGSGGGYPTGFAPGTSPGGYGSFPAYLGDQFPSPTLMAAAQLMYTDPAEFAQKYSPLINKQFLNNYDVANDLALKQLNTEIEGMNAFVPAASALKRRETSADNLFNQSERTRQINAVSPGLNGAIQDQLGRAQTYASGRAPDEVTDRGLELNARSASADQSLQGGFGASSSVARKASDLMSADQRIKLSQYGDQLLGQNVQNQNYLTAPTEYSNAGQQVNVMPSVSGSQLGANNLNQLNQYSMLPISAALNSVVGQRTTQAGFEQQANSQNATTQNQFALEKFGYQAGYANSTAAAGQADINTKFQLDQQQQYKDTMDKYMKSSQNAGTLSSIAQALGAIFGGGSSGSSIVDKFMGLFSGDSGTASTEFGTNGKLDTGIDQTDIGGGSGSYTPPAERVDTNTDISGSTLSSDDILNYNDFAGTSDSGLTLYSNQLRSTRLPSAPINQTEQVAAAQQTEHPAVQATKVANSIMRSVGLSSTPKQGDVNLGYNARGQPTYSSRALNQSQDATIGSKVATGYGQILQDLGAFSDPKDRETFDSIISAGQDISIAASLADAASRGDKKAFVNTILSTFKKPLINALTDDKSNQAGINAAVSAAQLFGSWDKMSPAQRSLALTNIGLKTYQFGTGEDLGQKALVFNTDGTTGMTVSQGLGLLQAGYNTFSLIKNWNDMTALQKITGTAGTAADIAQLAKSFDLMGTGASGAAVATSEAALTNAGFNVAPAFGPGAVYTPLGTATAPEGYTVISQGANGTVAAPTANASSAASSGASEVSSVGTADYVIGGVAVAAGTYQVYKGWGQGGSQGVLNGVIGGSAIVGGLATMGYYNPYVAAGIMVISVAGDSINAGKSITQQKRDAVRGAIKTNGLISTDYNIKLADGSTFDMGVDGDGGAHRMTDLTKRSKEQIASKTSPELHIYDVDYTNDLDYTSALGGISLVRLLTGTKAANIDQIGGQVSNAAISNIGYNKEMTQENFNKMAANMRGFYSQAGIKSKADAYQLANMAFAENRISAADLASMHQAFNIMYNPDGYKTAQSLMAGRYKGLEEIDKGASTGVNVSGVIREGKGNPVAENKPTATKSKYDSIREGAGAVRPSPSSQAPARVDKFNPGKALGNKEDFIVANKNKYGQKPGKQFEVGSAY